MENLPMPPPTRRRLATGGWLAMASALLTVPWFMISVVFADRQGGWSRAAQVGLLAAGTALLIFLMTTLKRLLQGKYGYHRTDAPIALLIAANVVSALAGGVGLLVPSLEESLGLFGIAAASVIGILQIVLGARLLGLPDNLRGLHKPYCYLNIVTGFLLAVVVLLPVGMVAGAVADVMLGTIFFQAATEAQSGDALVPRKGGR
jgi:hypothetical protein